MNNHDTTAVTFTFQNSVEQIVKPAVYNEGAGAFLIDLALVSHNWFGVADFSVTLYNAGGPRCGWGGQIVIDDDNDLIADAWESDPANGFLSMSASSNDCGAPGIECNDASWDAESSNGNSHNGDGISKLDEYRGVKIGAYHYSLSPLRKEVFVDADSTSLDVTSIMSSAESQLDINIVMVSGLVAPGSLSVNGNARLEWLGGAAATPDKNYIRLIDRPLLFPNPQTTEEWVSDGLFVVNGTYATGKSAADCDFTSTCFRFSEIPNDLSLVLGLTQPNRHMIAPGVLGYRSSVSGVYGDFIANLWGTNGIPESVVHIFQWPVDNWEAQTEDDVQFYIYSAFYDSTSLNGDQDVTDVLNPFDLMSSPDVATNDSLDTRILGFFEDEFARMVMLHEFGHAVGISSGRSCRTEELADHNWSDNCHPLDGSSVMRSGLNPMGTLVFSDVDIMQMQLTGPLPR